VPEPIPAASAAPLLILASASPRRSALLAQIGVRHHVVPARIEERRLDGESIENCARRLAEQKALKVYARQSDSRPSEEPLPVLGADTVVAIEGNMLGKPRDRDDALEMLARLSGQEHEVITAVALAQRGVLTSKLNRNVVRFRVLTRAQCERYWDSGEPRDKAGAYAIQGRGAVFIDMLRGSYSGVMGLPLFETAELLTAAGLAVWQA
jgi:septum formation protein